MASRDIKELALPAQNAYYIWIAECKAEGIEVMTYCTYRSAAEQDELYKIGRTVRGEGVTLKRPMGRKVTNARGGDSFHQWRVAWDCVPVLYGKPQWDDLRTYHRMGELAKKHGIEWAGDWVSFTETAHFQYTQGLTLADFKAGKELQNGR